MPREKETPPELRWTVVRMMAYSVPTAKIALYCNLSESNIRAIDHQFRSTGDVIEPDRIELKGRKRKLHMDDLSFIKTSIESRPDIYLTDIANGLREVCGVGDSEPSVWRALKRMGYTRKKITRLAIERNEALRDAFVLKVGQYSPKQLVFIDESAVVRRIPHRGYSWAKSDQRAEMSDHSVQGARYSLLPAMSLDGIIYSTVTEGSFDGESLREFIRNLLDHMQPYPAPNSVVVMDHCLIHKVERLEEMIEERGCRMLSLPPYSPDFNPTGLAFSSIKAYLCHHHLSMQSIMTGRKEHHVEVLLRLNEAIFTVTPAEAEAWFRHCSYIH